MLAQKGKYLNALTIKSRRTNMWIVDFSKFDHMTDDITLFHTYDSCYKNITIKIVDGSLSKVVGTGYIIMPKDIKITYILCA